MYDDTLSRKVGSYKNQFIIIKHLDSDAEKVLYSKYYHIIEHIFVIIFFVKNQNH